MQLQQLAVPCHGVQHLKLQLLSLYIRDSEVISLGEMCIAIGTAKVSCAAMCISQTL